MRRGFHPPSLKDPGDWEVAPTLVVVCVWSALLGLVTGHMSE